MKVTLLNGIYKTQVGHIELTELLERFKNGVYASEVFKCRDVLNFKGKKAYQDSKVNIPCFTPSGRFAQAWSEKKGTKRPIPPTKSYLIEYNGIVVLDYDDLDTEQLLFLAEDVKQSPYTFASFFSPPNRGYKVLVKTTNKSAEQHYNAFQAVRAYYKSITGVEDDKSSSNINRLCFMSVDMHLYHNPESTIFEFQPTLFKKKEINEEVPPVAPLKIKQEAEYVVKALNRVEKRGFHYVDGQRRDFIKQFSIECVKYGVSEHECKSFVEGNLLGADCDEKMVFKLVADMYEWVKPNEHGLYLKWTEENKNNGESDKKPKKSKGYTPKLHKENSSEDLIISIPELGDEQLNELDEKVKKSILYQRHVEETLEQFFDFRFNILKNREEYRQKGWKEYKEMDKKAYNSIARALRYHCVKFTPAFLEGIILSDFSEDVHPLKEKFIGWANMLGDDETDYITQVSNLVKTDAPKGLFEAVFKKWVVASVANVFVESQCTNHHCLILCGSQGTNKTTFFSSLFSPDYRFIGHIDLRNKDSLILLTDTFLIVLDEQFSVLSNDREWETLKSTVTTPNVKARWHYAKNSKIAPRIANFCGTANRIGILQDDTGNRRFAPFQLTAPIDINKLQEMDLRKMWAQAYKLYKEGWYYLPDAKKKTKWIAINRDSKSLTTSII